MDDSDGRKILYETLEGPICRIGIILSIGEVDEASSTELESQTIKVDTDKSGGKVGATRPV